MEGTAPSPAIRATSPRRTPPCPGSASNDYNPRWRTCGARLTADAADLTVSGGTSPERVLELVLLVGCRGAALRIGPARPGAPSASGRFAAGLEAAQELIANRRGGPSADGLMADGPLTCRAEKACGTTSSRTRRQN